MCRLPACPAGIVTNADFDNAILRAVAGIEKKRSVLQVGLLQRSGPPAAHAVSTRERGAQWHASACTPLHKCGLASAFRF